MEESDHTFYYGITPPLKLTKREYFAAMDMQGLLASNFRDKYSVDLDKLSAIAVEQADSIIMELNKKKHESQD